MTGGPYLEGSFLKRNRFLFSFLNGIDFVVFFYVLLYRCLIYNNNSSSQCWRGDDAVGKSRDLATLGRHLIAQPNRDFLLTAVLNALRLDALMCVQGVHLNV